jgi:hypothetical protein
MEGNRIILCAEKLRFLDIKEITEKEAEESSFSFINFSITNIKEVVMSKLHYFLCISFILILSAASYAQTTVLNFDGTANQWVTGKASPENTFLLTDNFDDYDEGVGSMEIRTEIILQAASWGTWTDAAYTFPSIQNWTGAKDLRLRVKIKQNPVHNRSLQFTLDLVDSSSQGQELWRYMEDLDFLYHFNVDAVGFADEWHDIVIPLNRMEIPVWSPTLDGQINLEQIVRFAFGIHSDSSGVATDTVVVLFDDLRIASSVNVGSTLINCDGNASNWNITLNDPVNNSLTVTDNFDDYIEGIGSHQVTAVLVNYPNIWGTWTDAKYAFPAPVDLTGATELRFWIKIVDPAQRGLLRRGLKASSNSQFTLDLLEPTDLWRWLPAGAGIYGLLIGTNKHVATHPDGGWNEIVLPFTDFGFPSWAPSNNGVLDLDSIQAIGFGIHGDDTSGVAAPDTIVILIDNFYATGSTSVGVNPEEPGIASFGFRLDHNYPNPFNPSTTISFDLPEDGFVNLKIYNIQGEEVYTVVDNRFKIRGSYEFKVDLSSLASGIYFYTLEQNKNVMTKKMTLLK